jgi:hypothetical protein
MTEKEKRGTRMTVKGSVKNEIKHIHEEYDKEGGKSIKPSFNYIVVVESSDDFFVTDTLSEAKDIAIEYGTEHNKFMSIYEVKLFGNEYKANLIFAYKWYKRELVEDSERYPMHIAWRTRGDLLEVNEND